MFKWILSAFIFIVTPILFIAHAQVNRKKINYELYLNPQVKGLHPTAAVVDIDLGEIKNVTDVATVGQCLVKQADETWTGEQCGTGGGGGDFSSINPVALLANTDRWPLNKVTLPDTTDFFINSFTGSTLGLVGQTLNSTDAIWTSSVFSPQLMSENLIHEAEWDISVGFHLVAESVTNVAELLVEFIFIDSFNNLPNVIMTKTVNFPLADGDTWESFFLKEFNSNLRFYNQIQLRLTWISGADLTFEQVSTDGLAATELDIQLIPIGRNDEDQAKFNWLHSSSNLNRLRNIIGIRNFADADAPWNGVGKPTASTGPFYFSDYSYAVPGGLGGSIQHLHDYLTNVNYVRFQSSTDENFPSENTASWTEYYVPGGLTTAQTQALVDASITAIPRISQAAAVAGTGTGFALWSPLRVAQLVAAQGGQGITVIHSDNATDPPSNIGQINTFLVRSTDESVWFKVSATAWVNLAEMFTPSQANIYASIKATILAGSNVTITPDDTANTLRLDATSETRTVDGDALSTTTFLFRELYVGDGITFIRPPEDTMLPPILTSINDEGQTVYRTEATLSNTIVKAVVRTIDITVTPETGIVRFLGSGGFAVKASSSAELEIDLSLEISKDNGATWVRHSILGIERPTLQNAQQTFNSRLATLSSAIETPADVPFVAGDKIRLVWELQSFTPRATWTDAQGAVQGNVFQIVFENPEIEFSQHDQNLVGLRGQDGSGGEGGGVDFSADQAGNGSLKYITQETSAPIERISVFSEEGRDIPGILGHITPEENTNTHLNYQNGTMIPDHWILPAALGDGSFPFFLYMISSTQVRFAGINLDYINPRDFNATERAKIVILTRNASRDSVLAVMLSDITRDSLGVYSYSENSLHSGENIDLAIVDITQLPNLDLATGIISIGEAPTSSVKTITNKELAIRLSEELTAARGRAEQSIQYLTEVTRQLSLHGSFSQTVEEIPNSLHLTHEIPLGGERTTTQGPFEASPATLTVGDGGFLRGLSKGDAARAVFGIGGPDYGSVSPDIDGEAVIVWNHDNYGFIFIRETTYWKAPSNIVIGSVTLDLSSAVATVSGSFTFMNLTSPDPLNVVSGDIDLQINYQDGTSEFGVGSTITTLTPIEDLEYSTQIINVSTNQHNVLVVPVPRADDETDYQVKFVEGRPVEREDYSSLEFRSATAGEAYITTIPNRSNHKFIEYLRNNYFIEGARQKMFWTFTNGSESRTPTHLSVGVPGIIADNQDLTFLSVESGTRFNTSLHDTLSDAMDFYTSGFATTEVRRRFGLFFEETLESTPAALVANGVEIPLTFQTLGGLTGHFTAAQSADFTKPQLDETSWNVKLEDGTYLFSTTGGPPVVTDHALSRYNHNGLAQSFTRYITTDTFGDKTIDELNAQTYNVKYSDGSYESHTIEVVGEEIEFFPLNNWIHIVTDSPIFKYFATELKFPLNLTGTLTLEKRERTPRQSRFAGYTDGIPEVGFLPNLADAFNTILYRGRALVHLTKPQGPFNAEDQGHSLTFGDTNPGSTSGYYGWAREALADFTTGAVGELQGSYPDELDAILVEKQERAYVYIIGSSTILINSFLAFISTDKSYTLESSVQGSGSVQFKRVVDEDGNFMSADDLDGVMAGDTKKIAIAGTNDLFIGDVDPTFPIGDYRVNGARTLWERVWINNFEPYTKAQIATEIATALNTFSDENMPKTFVSQTNSDTNLSNSAETTLRELSITPRKQGSKFDVFVNIEARRQNESGQVSAALAQITLQRRIGNGAWVTLGDQVQSAVSLNSVNLNHFHSPNTKIWQDSPNTTTEIHYRVQGRSASGSAAMKATESVLKVVEYPQGAFMDKNIIEEQKERYFREEKHKIAA